MSGELRAVVDINVFVSALLKPTGPPAAILEALRSKQFTLVLSEPLLAELARVLNRDRFARCGVTPEIVEETVALLRAAADLASVPGTLQLCRDPKDDVVIETTVAGQAHFLVSGDQDLAAVPEVAEHL